MSMKITCCTVLEHTVEVLCLVVTYVCNSWVQLSNLKALLELSDSIRSSQLGLITMSEIQSSTFHNFESTKLLEYYKIL